MPQSNADKEATRKRLEAFVHEMRASETVARAISQVHQRQEEEELETALFERRAPNLSEDSKPLRWQLTEATLESIWEDIDMLEGDPAHRGMAMRNARFKPVWHTAETSEDCGIRVSSINGSGQFLRVDTFTKLSDLPKLEPLQVESLQGTS